MLVTDAFGGRGGIAKFNRDLLSALCSNEKCLEIVAVPRLIMDDPGILPEKLTFAVEAAGSKIKYIHTVLKILIGSPGFDLIISGHINLLPVAFLAKAFFRVPITLTIHGIEAWQATRSLFGNYLAPRVDNYISVSELTRKRFVAWTGINSEKGYILPNSVNLKKFTPGPKQEKLIAKYKLAGKKVLMTFGRMDSRERAKGFDEVLEIMPELLKERKNATYLIAGDGPDRERLEKKVLDMGLGKHVVFSGFVSEEEKVDLYRLADVYVMPSSGEGFGIVFLEAMACGIPVIASRKDGGYEAVQQGALGEVVDPENSQELLEATIRNLNKNDRIIKRGLEFFSAERYEERVHAWIKGLSNAEYVTRKEGT